MAVVPITVTTTTDQHPELLLREIRTATQAGMHAVGSTWARDLLPEHYHPNARQRFNHRPRTQKYRRRKEALAKLGRVEDGGKIDGVFTGNTRRSVLRAKNLVASTATKSTITIVGPDYFPARNRGKINLGTELKTVSDRHERIVTAAGETALDKALRRIKATKTTRTR